MEPTFIPQLVRALTRQKLTFLAVLLSTPALGDRGYETFELDAKKVQVVQPGELNLKRRGYSLKAGEVRVDKPSVDAKEYVFAKQAYVSRRRDDAIRLIRQRVDLGSKANRDNELLRLGQLYTEKYMELSYLENELYSSALERWEKKTDQEKKKTKQPQPNTKRSKRYLKLALDAFERLEKEFPKFYKKDEVTFFIGFVSMEFGQTKKGLKYLNKMVTQYKKSRKYEEAVLYLGDHHFYKQRFKKALSFFSIITSRKDSPLYHYALYKKAWCQLNTGQASSGLANMKNLIEELRDEDEKSKFNLREQAQKDIVTFFVKLEQVQPALKYFQETQSEKVALENLKIMASSWLSNAKDRPAIEAYSILVNQFEETSEAPKLAIALFEARSRIGKTSSAVDTLAGAMKKYHPGSSWAKEHAKDTESKELMEELENTAKKAASFYHHTAQKTKNKSYYDHALKMYRALVDNYPDLKEQRQYTFYMGEILYAQKKYLLASYEYMKLAKNEPKDKLAADAAYNALLALDQMTYKEKEIKRFTKQEKLDFKQDKRSIPKAEKEFIDVANFYFEEYPKAPKKVDVRFRIARIYYQYHHFDEAQKVFHQIAMEDSSHKSASTAAHIVLDIYNIRKDYANLQKYSALYAANPKLGDPKFKGEMKTIKSELAFKDIEQLEAKKEWAKAGEAYLNFFRSQSKSPLAEKALYNSVVTLEKANDEAKLKEASAIFLAKYPQHSYSKRLYLKAAQKAEKEYRFEEAQRKFEEFYNRFPKDDEATKALYNAALFADLLEQNQKAILLYDRYLSKARPDRKTTRAIWLSEAKIYERRNQNSSASKMYTKLIDSAPTSVEKYTLLKEYADFQKRSKRLSGYRQTTERLSKMAGRNVKASQVGNALPLIASHRLGEIEGEKRAYERVTLRLPVSSLVSKLKQKQTKLTALAKKYDAIVELGEPESGVIALHEKAAAYRNFVEQYRSIEVSSKYKAKEKEELEKELKVLDGDLIEPLAKQAKGYYKACADKAAEFFVVTPVAENCFRQTDPTVRGGDEVALVPQAAYWTTEWVAKELSKR